MKKAIIVLSILIAMATTAEVSYASQYGQEVLGEKAPEVEIVHEPVAAGLEDHPEILGVASLLASYAFYRLSKKQSISLR